MRRIILGSAGLVLAAGAAVPALAAPPVPPIIGVHGNGNGGICVTVSYQVPQCVDLGQVGAAK